MKEIEIKDVQNVAQNMIVGSKQHALFNPVTGNNPNLVAGQVVEPEYGQVDIAVNRNTGEVAALVQVGGQSDPGCCSNAGGETVGMGENLGGGGIANEPKGLNSNLYGMLKPCDKQFGQKAAPEVPVALPSTESENYEDTEDNSGY